MTQQRLRAEIIGYDSGWGCGDYGCEDGPAAIAADSLLDRLRTAGVDAKWRGPLGLKHLAHRDNFDTKEQTLPIQLECLRRLAPAVRHVAENGHIPIVIGGDNSSSIGTWSGIVGAARAHGKFGLIWMDAHMDSHTYETSSQGKWGGWWHGQPVAALMGHGLAALRQVGDPRTKLSPDHISLIGAYSYEPAEKELLDKTGVPVHFCDEVTQRGFAAVLAELVERATHGTEGFGLTIDLDVFCFRDAPGVGSPENKGLNAADVLPIIRGLGWHPKFRGLEVVELNPHNDEKGKTARLAENLIAAIFTKD